MVSLVSTLVILRAGIRYRRLDGVTYHWNSIDPLPTIYPFPVHHLLDSGRQYESSRSNVHLVDAAA